VSRPPDLASIPARPWPVTAIGAVAALALTGCLHDAPHTTTGGWAPECAPTPSGEACLAIHFSIEGDARASGKLTGTYHWALYHNGKVHGWGPDGDPAYDGLKTGVDLTAPGSTDTTYAPGIPAGAYQILAYLDANLNDSADTDEPITNPTGGFQVPANAMTTVDSVLIRLKPPFVGLATSTPEER
jgi:hypothetical protein